MRPRVRALAVLAAHVLANVVTQDNNLQTKVQTMKRSSRLLIVPVAVIAMAGTVLSQGPQRRGHGGPGGPGGLQNRGMAAAGAAAGNNQVLGGAAQNFQGGQNMPTVGELAQSMIANFDTDGSGALDLVELQNALAALRQMMMKNQMRAGRQNAAGQANMAQGNVAQRQALGRNAAVGNAAAMQQGGRGGRRGR